MPVCRAKILTPLLIILKQEYLLITLIFISFALRLIFYFHAEPGFFPDSQEYNEAARDFLQTGEFSQLYRRPPGYPLFLALNYFIFGYGNLQAVVFMQLLLGSLNLALLYLIVRRIASSKGLALITAACYLLDFYVINFETAILTETLSITLLLAGFYLFIISRRGGNYWLAAGGGLLLSLLALTRAIFQLSALVLIVFSLIGERILNIKNSQPKRALTNYLIILLINLVILVGWSTRNYFKFGFMGLTSSLGLSLSNHAGQFFYTLATQDKTEQQLIEIYHHHAKQRSTHVMAVWFALPEMEASTGLSEPELNKRLLALSLRSIRKNMGGYLQSVVLAWQDFWSTRWLTYGSPTLLKFIVHNQPYRFIYGTIESRILRQRLIQSLIPWLVIMGAAGLIYLNRLDKEKCFIIILILAGILYVAVVSSLIELGENGRYRTPVEPFIFSVVILGLVEGITKLGKNLVAKNTSKSETVNNEVG